MTNCLVCYKQHKLLKLSSDAYAKHYFYILKDCDLVVSCLIRVLKSFANSFIMKHCLNAYSLSVDVR